MVTAPAAIMLPGPYCACMGWLLAAWLSGSLAALLLAALGAWLLTSDGYRGAHEPGAVYHGGHRLHEDEHTVIMRWTGERFEPAPPWTE